MYLITRIYAFQSTTSSISSKKSVSCDSSTLTVLEVIGTTADGAGAGAAVAVATVVVSVVVELFEEAIAAGASDGGVGSVAFLLLKSS